jgi:hypothetical protein
VYLFREWTEWPVERPRARSGAASIAGLARTSRRCRTERGGLFGAVDFYLGGVTDQPQVPLTCIDPCVFAAVFEHSLRVTAPSVMRNGARTLYPLVVRVPPRIARVRAASSTPRVDQSHRKVQID